MINSQKENEINTPEQFERLTNKLTESALFLVFIVGLPGIVGVLFTAVINLLIGDVEGFLGGEYSFGMFLFGIFLSLPIFYFLFLKSRKKNFYRFITPENYRLKLLSVALQYFLPLIIISSVFQILGTVQAYPSFNFIFQLGIYSAISIVLFSFYRFSFLRTEIKNSESENLVDQHDSPYLIALNNGKIQKIFSVPAILFAISSLVNILYFRSGLNVIILTSLLLLLNILTIELVHLKFKESKALGLGLLIKLLSLEWIVFGFILIAQSFYFSSVNIYFYIFACILVGLKIGQIYFKISSQKLFSFINFQYNYSWLILLNSIISIALNFSIIGYLLIDNIANIWVVLAFLTLILETLLENKFSLINTKIMSYFLVCQLFTLNIIISFIFLANFLSNYLFVQLFIFFIISIFNFGFLNHNHVITDSVEQKARQITYICILLTIGLIFSQISVNNLLLFNDSAVFTYLFFISLSTLSTLFYLHKISSKIKNSKYFSISLLSNLSFTMFCFFVMIQNLLISFNYSFLLTLSGSYNSILFKPSGFYLNFEGLFENFFSWIGQNYHSTGLFIKSSNGIVALWNIVTSALIAIGFNAICVKIFSLTGIISQNLNQQINLIFKSFFLVFFSIGINLISFSLTFFFVSIMASQIIISNIISSLYKNKWKFTDEKVFLDIKFVFKLVFRLEILILVGLLSLEYLKISPFFNLILTSIVGLVLINNSPIIVKWCDKLHFKVKIRQLINAIFYFLIVGFMVGGSIEYRDVFVSLNPLYLSYFVAITGYIISRLIYKGFQKLYHSKIIGLYYWKSIEYSILNLRLIFLVTIFFEFLYFQFFFWIDQIYHNSLLIFVISCGALLLGYRLTEIRKKLHGEIPKNQSNIEIISKGKLWIFSSIQVIILWQTAVIGFIIAFLLIPTSFFITNLFFASIIFCFSLFYSMKLIEREFLGFKEIFLKIRLILSWIISLLIGTSLTIFTFEYLQFNAVLSLCVGFSIEIVLFNIFQITRKFVQSKIKHSLNILFGSSVLLLLLPGIMIQFPILQSIVFWSKIHETCIIFAFFMTASIYLIYHQLHQGEFIKKSRYHSGISVTVELLVLIFSYGIVFYLNELAKNMFGSYYEINLVFTIGIILSIISFPISFISNNFSKNKILSESSYWKRFWTIQNIVSWVIFPISLSIGFSIWADYTPEVVASGVFIIGISMIYPLNKLSEIFPNRSQKILKIKENLEITLLGIICIVGFLASYFWLNLGAIPSSFICLSIFLIEFHLTLTFRSLFNKIFHLLNGIIVLTLTILGQLIIILSLFKAGINLYDLNLFAMITAHIIIIFICLKFMNLELKKEERITETSFIRNKFVMDHILIFTFDLLIISFTLLIPNLFEYNEYLFPIEATLLMIFVPIFGLFIIFNIMVLKNAYCEQVKYFNIIKWEQFIFWTISSNIILYLFLVFIEFDFRFIGFIFFFGCLGIIHSLDLFRAINPNRLAIIEKLKNAIKQLSMIVNAISSFYFNLRIYGLNIYSTMILTLAIQIALIYLIKPYRKLFKPILMEINAIALLIGSFCLSLSINCYFYLSWALNPTAFLALIFIPLLGFFGFSYILSIHSISKTTYNRMNQIGALLVIINAFFFVYFTCPSSFNILDSLFTATLAISILIIIDNKTFQLLLKNDSVVAIFSVIMLVLSVLTTLMITINFIPDLKYCILISCFMETLFIHFIFNYFVWANARVTRTYLKSTNQITDHSNFSLNYDDQAKKIEVEYKVPTKIAHFSNNIASNIESNHHLVNAILMMSTFIISSAMIVANVIDGTSFSYFDLLIIGSLGILALNMIESKAVNFLYYNLISSISLAFNFILIIFPGLGAIYTYLTYIILFSFIILSTNIPPRFNLNKYLMNLCNILMLISFQYLFGLTWDINLFISSIIFELATFKKYKDILFKSFKSVSIGYLLAYNLHGYIGANLLTSIATFLSIFLIIEWFILEFDLKGQKSIIKTIIGYSGLIATVLSYSLYYNMYPIIFGYITPIVLSGVILICIVLRNLPIISHQIKLLNQIILVSTFGVIFFSGMNYFFSKLVYCEVLSSLLAFAVVGYLYVFMFDWLGMNTPRQIILLSLGTGSLAAGGFIYFLLVESSAPFIGLPFRLAFPISLDFFILMFFLAIGVYKRSFKDIWSVGVYAWLAVPVVNYFLIAPLISGVDTLSSSIAIGNEFIGGSAILAIIICSLLYLPVLLTKLKSQFNKIIYAFWVELVALSYWGAINIFPENPWLQGGFVTLIGLLLVLPILFIYKKWKYISITWPFLGAANIIFLDLYLQLNPTLLIAVSCLIAGIYILTLGYFPNIRKAKVVWQNILIIGGYTLIIGSIFVLIYYYLNQIVPDEIITSAITILIISFTILSGKYFRIQDSIIKKVHALSIILDLILLLWRIFYIVGSTLEIPGFSAFGIFLGLAFASGATLSFQSRKYLPDKYYYVIWFGMALFTGLSVFQLFLSILFIGPWASIGIMVLVTGTICLKFFKNYLGIFYSLVVGCISLILMQIIVQIEFVSSYSALFYLILLFSVELIYTVIIKDTKYAIFKDYAHNQELASILWFGLSILICITSGIVLSFFDNISLFTNILISISWIALLNLNSSHYIMKNQLFSDSNMFKTVIRILNTSFVQILYIFFSIIIGINLHTTFNSSSFNSSLITIFFQGSIIFGGLFLIYEFIDKFLFKTLEENYRKHVSWGTYLLFILSNYVFFILLFNDWKIPTLIISILSFGLTELLRNAKVVINAKPFRTISLTLVNIPVAFLMWDHFDMIQMIKFHQFDVFTLGMIIPLLLYFVFMKLDLINSKLMIPVYRILSIVLGIYFEELFRLYLTNSIYLIFGIFILVQSSMNFFFIKSPKHISAYWALFTGSLASFVYEIFPYESLNPFDQVILFISIYSIIFSVILYSLGEKYLYPRTLKNLGDEEIAENIQQYASSFNYLGGVGSVQKIRSVFSNIILVNGIVFAIAIMQLWIPIVHLIRGDMIGIVTDIFLYSLILPMIFICSVLISIKYSEKHDFDQSRLIEKITNPKLKNIFHYLAIFFISLCVFVNYWIIFDLSSLIIEKNFTSLALDLLITSTIVYLSMKLHFIPNKGFILVSFIISFFVSFLIEEFFRNIVTFSNLASSGVFLLTFILINWRKTYNSILAYAFWGTFSYAITSFIFSLINTGSESSLLLYQKFFWFIFIYSTVSCLINLVLANGLLDNIPFVQNYTNRINEVDESSIEIISLPNNKLENNKEISLKSDLENNQSAFQYLKYGHIERSFSQTVLISWLLLETVLISSLVTNLWNIIFTRLFIENPVNAVQHISILIPVAIAFFTLYLNIISKYVRKYGLDSKFYYPIFNKTMINDILGYICAFSFIIILTSHLWIFLNISNAMSLYNFTSFAFILSLDLLILAFLMKRQIIKPFYLRIFEVLFNICFSGLSEEFIRNILNMPVGFTLASLTVIILVFMNTFQVKNQLSSILYWNLLIISFSVLIINGIFKMSFAFLLWHQILIAFLIFNSIFFIIHGLIANGFIQRLYLRVKGFKLNKANEFGSNFNNDINIGDIPILVRGYNEVNIEKKVFITSGIIESLFLAPLISLGVNMIYYFFSLEYIGSLLEWASFHNGSFAFSFIAVSFFTFSILINRILKYLKKNELWIEKPHLWATIEKAIIVNGIIFYSILPLIIITLFNYIIGLGLQTEFIILFDVSIFLLTYFLELYYWDRNVNHFLSVHVNLLLSKVALIFFNLCFSIILGLFLSRLFSPVYAIILSLTFLSLISNDLKLIHEFNSMIQEIIKESIIASFYLEIIILFSLILFETVPWFYALTFSLILGYVALEVESRVIPISFIHNKIQILKPYAFLFMITDLLLFINLFNLPTYNLLQLIIGLLFCTISLLYWNRLYYYSKDEIKWQNINKIIGITLYAELFSLISFLTFPLYQTIEFDIDQSATLAILCFLTQTFLAFYLFLLFDGKVFHLIDKKYLKYSELGTFFGSVVLGATDILFYLFSIIKPGNPHNPGSGTTPSEISLSDIIPSNQILIPVLVVSILIGVALFIRFRNKIINQVVYAIVSLQLFFIIFNLEVQSILILCAILALVLYPFIFFMEQMRNLLKKVWEGMLWLKDFISDSLIKAWNWMKNFYEKHKVGVFIALGVIIGVIPFFWIKNVFFSIIIFLSVIYPVSPERKNDKTSKEFALKVLYRTGIIVSVIGFLFNIIPAIPWVYALILLAILGYLLFIVWRSEELYNLPIYWRFFSSLATIIDFGLLIYLAFFY